MKDNFSIKRWRWNQMVNENKQSKIHTPETNKPFSIHSWRAKQFLMEGDLNNNPVGVSQPLVDRVSKLLMDAYQVVCKEAKLGEANLEKYADVVEEFINNEVRKDANYKYDLADENEIIGRFVSFIHSSDKDRHQQFIDAEDEGKKDVKVDLDVDDVADEVEDEKEELKEGFNIRKWIRENRDPEKKYQKTNTGLAYHAYQQDAVDAGDGGGGIGENAKKDDEDIIEYVKETLKNTFEIYQGVYETEEDFEKEIEEYINLDQDYDDEEYKLMTEEELEDDFEKFIQSKNQDVNEEDSIEIEEDDIEFMKEK